MKPKLNYKSVMVGLASGLLMAGVLGAGLAHEQQPGRFQMSTMESHAFVLDTVTGQVWEKSESVASITDDDGFSDPKLNLKKKSLGK